MICIRLIMSESEKKPKEPAKKINKIDTILDNTPIRCSPKVLAKGSAMISFGSIILFFTITIFFLYVIFRFLQYIGINELYIFIAIVVILFALFCITIGKYYLISNCEGIEE